MNGEGGGGTNERVVVPHTVFQYNPVLRRNGATVSAPRIVRDTPSSRTELFAKSSAATSARASRRPSSARRLREGLGAAIQRKSPVTPPSVARRRASVAPSSSVQSRSSVSRSKGSENTAPQTFHSPVGDVTKDFMHTSFDGHYYWGDQFGVAGLSLANGGGTMWFLLPDEGVSPEDLLADPEAMDFLLSGGGWDQEKYLIVNLALPKFDISSQIDLGEGLQALGVTDVFDETESNFEPMLSQQPDDPIILSQVQHDVRVTVDEEGVRNAGAVVYYANVDMKDGKLVTGTSRSLGIVGIADTLEDAESNCEQALKSVKCDAMAVRHDIGTRALVQRRVDHMRELRSA